MHRRLPIATLILLASAPLAYAQPVTGPYISLGGGGNLMQDEHLRLNPDVTGDRFIYDIGEAGAASAGYGFGNGFRVEVEGDFRNNPLREFAATPTPAQASGRQQNYGGMLNALFDMDIRQNWIYPYVGVGAGYMKTRWNGIQNLQVGGGPYALHAGGSYGDFAYQGIFGLSFPVPFVRGLSLTAEYRWLSLVGNEKFAATSIAANGDPAERAFGKLGITSDNNHTALIGLRYELFPPPPPAQPAPVAAPPPPPAPAPTASRTYLVFFDWDRADLTARARQIVAEAAQATTHVQTTRIEVNGYTDLSGTAAYNQKLSIRRAQTVESELVRDGVPKTEISIQGYGETHPLVPTAPGIREPQNRRVEIILN
jgi:outer membrane protein OmpA-like peptidoglycan-associated protein